MSSYTINKTDGSILTDNIPDGSVDTTATDLTLIGKNAVNYGEAFNENFVHLLENFANSSPPPNAIVGQLWYDTSDGRLKVNSGTEFKVAAGTILSATAPTNAIAGDIWIDTENQQLRFYVSDSTYVLAGPGYTASQGVTGIQTTTVFDTAEKEHVIGILYIADTVIGIFSKDSFTPSPAIDGYTGDIQKGFNLGNASGLTFDVPVTSASQLVDDLNNIFVPDSFVKTIGSSIIAYDQGSEATLTVQSDNPLILGSQENTLIISEPAEFNIRGVGENQSAKIEVSTATGLQGVRLYNSGYKVVGIQSSSGDGANLTLTFGTLGDGAVQQIVEPFQIGDEVDIFQYTIPGSSVSRVLLGTGVITAINLNTVIVSNTDVGGWDGEIRKTFVPRFGVLTEEPLVELDVNGRGLFRSDIRVKGAAVVEGDFTVLGTTTSITTTDTNIKDNIIVLNDGEVGPGITNPDGYAGIEIDRGPGSNKRAKWKFKEGLAINWESSHHINLKSELGLLNETYRIRDLDILNRTTLGSTVVNSSLTSVGHLTSLTAANLSITGNTLQSNSSVISVNNNEIADLVDTSYTNQSPPQLVDAGQAASAVNNQTLQDYTAGLPLQFTIEFTDATGATLTDFQAATILTDTFPVDDHRLGTLLYVHCTKTTYVFDNILLTVTPNVVRTMRVYRLTAGTPNYWFWDTNYNINYGF